MYTLADWHFIKSSVIGIMSAECEIRVNESRDFAKIACVRSRDFSGPGQSSVTMADKDKDVGASEAIMSLSPVTVHSVVIGGVSPMKTMPCLLGYYAYVLSSVCVCTCMCLCACMFLCVCLAVKYYLNTTQFKFWRN